MPPPRSVINVMCRGLLVSSAMRVAAMLYAVPWTDVTWTSCKWYLPAAVATCIELYFWSRLTMIYIDKWVMHLRHPHCFTAGCIRPVVEVQLVKGRKHMTLDFCAVCSHLPLNIKTMKTVMPEPSGPPARMQHVDQDGGGQEVTSIFPLQTPARQAQAQLRSPPPAPALMRPPSHSGRPADSRSSSK